MSQNVSVRPGPAAGTKANGASAPVGVRAQRRPNYAIDGAAHFVASSKQRELDGLLALARAVKTCGLSVTPSHAFSVAGRQRLMAHITATSLSSQPVPR
jgi:hypothetical protein